MYPGFWKNFIKNIIHYKQKYNIIRIIKRNLFKQYYLFLNEIKYKIYFFIKNIFI